MSTPPKRFRRIHDGTRRISIWAVAGEPAWSQITLVPEVAPSHPLSAVRAVVTATGAQWLIRHRDVFGHSVPTPCLTVVGSYSICRPLDPRRRAEAMHSWWEADPSWDWDGGALQLLAAAAEIPFEERLGLLRVHADSEFESARRAARQGCVACRHGVPSRRDVTPARAKVIQRWDLRRAALRLADANAIAFAVACADTFAGDARDLVMAATAVTATPCELGDER